MAFWHEDRFGMRKCAVSQKYFYKLARNTATCRRITKRPLAYFTYIFILQKKELKGEILLLSCTAEARFLFVKKPKISRFSWLSPPRFVNCGGVNKLSSRNSLYQHFHISDHNARHTSSLNARSLAKIRHMHLNN